MSNSKANEAINKANETLALQRKVIKDLTASLRLAETGLEAAVKRAIRSNTGDGTPVNATVEYGALVDVRKTITKHCSTTQPA